MQQRKEYIIQFVGLNLGEHVYDYTIDGSFFTGMEYPEIQTADIQANVRLLKQSTMLILQFEIKGTVKIECDRCTDEFNMPVQGNYRLIVKLGGHETGNEDDDIITLPANEHELDLSQYIYEYIVLSLPIKRVHPDDAEGNSTCNREMLAKLNVFLTEEENKTSEPIDPRWEALKNITLN